MLCRGFHNVTKQMCESITDDTFFEKVNRKIHEENSDAGQMPTSIKKWRIGYQNSEFMEFSFPKEK